jgi:hypothetical protein
MFRLGRKDHDCDGLAQALRYLKYHKKLLDGKSDEHDANDWRQQDRFDLTSKNGFVAQIGA